MLLAHLKLHSHRRRLSRIAFSVNCRNLHQKLTIAYTHTHKMPQHLDQLKIRISGVLDSADKQM